MKRRNFLIGYCFICILALCGSCTYATQSEPNLKGWTTPEYIFFDTSDPAFCHMIAVENLEEFLIKNKDKEDVIKSLSIPWGDFYSHKEGYLKNCQIRNDYPDYNLPDEVAKILVSNDGIMFSITWNGGIAVTYLDHKHARKIYDIYNQDPERYSQLEKDKKGDPIYPGHWLYSLLKNYKLGPESQPARKEESLDQIKEAAEQGFADAQYQLGELYEAGTGVTQSFHEAEKWYRAAAEEGNIPAKMNLKVLCEKVPDVCK